jgi:hypothetical protein
LAPASAAPAGACRAIAVELGEPLLASAPIASLWLLVEHTGAWARKPFAQGFDSRAATVLDRLSEAAPLKPLAVRRPGSVPPDAPRLVALAYCGPGPAWLNTTTIGDDRDLLDLELDPSELAGGSPPPGFEADDDPMYLVCTHARRDACCGAVGRSVARALAAARPGRVWECSHLGGHRFAANLLCLPTGLLYGRVLDPGQAVGLAEDLERGELDVGHLRGISWQIPAVQAATALLREQTGLRRLHEVRPVSAGQASDGTWQVLLETPGGRWVVRVRWSPTGIERPVSCGSDEGEDPGRWEIEALVRR